MVTAEFASRFASTAQRRRLKLLAVQARRPTASLRTLPDFLVIGTQRGGTSSLFKYLGQHPAVIPSLRKEIGYLSRMYPRGLGWYRCHFPLSVYRTYMKQVHGRPTLTFEATPNYLFHPHAAARAAEVVPSAKVIVLLRDPVTRAFSHYQHMVRLGFENLPFEEAIAAESSRIRPDLDALARDPLHNPRALMLFSYVTRGLYVDQLNRWLSRFPSERCLIIRSEDLFGDPPAVYRGVLDFLGLPAWEPAAFRNFSYSQDRADPAANPGAESGRRLEPDTRRQLIDTFGRHNQRLYDLLGRDFGWESSPTN